MCQVDHRGKYDTLRDGTSGFTCKNFKVLVPNLSGVLDFPTCYSLTMKCALIKVQVGFQAWS